MFANPFASILGHSKTPAQAEASPFTGSVLDVGYGKIEYVPLCSFGPGGAFTVDWEVRHEDVADPRRLYPPRTLGSVVRRLAGWVLWDLKGWLIADHPSRKFRIDYRPAALEPCAACGISSLWPHWFSRGEKAPSLATDQSTLAAGQTLVTSANADIQSGSHHASDLTTEDLPSHRYESLAPISQASSENLNLPTSNFDQKTAIYLPKITQNLSKPQKNQEKPDENRPQILSHDTPSDASDIPENYPFPHNFTGSSDLEPVALFSKTPAARLIARLSGDPKDPGTLRLFDEDDLIPSGIPAAQLPDSRTESHPLTRAGSADSHENTHLPKEQKNDPNSQTTQNPHRHPRLPSSQRLLAHDAGTGRSARRLKGHNLRTRRSPGTKTTDLANPQQGSLFGSLADGEAA